MYNLHIDKAIKEIKSSKAKRVCIQLPDGLKPKAKEIVDKLKKQTKAELIIWAGSCYGACDTPELKKLKVDLLIQFGHNEMLP